MLRLDPSASPTITIVGAPIAGISSSLISWSSAFSTFTFSRYASNAVQGAHAGPGAASTGVPASIAAFIPPMAAVTTGDHPSSYAVNDAVSNAFMLGL